MYVILAYLNKILLPNFTKQKLDITKATKFQKHILAWKYFVTIRKLGK